MALKPTIYKFKIDISNLDTNNFDSMDFTVAQHPSESAERMLVRVLAFCLNADSALTFTRGLSAVDEPDLWLKNLDDTIEKWIEVGEPDFDRLKKASRRAKQVLVYSFNTKSDVWWQPLAAEVSALKLEVFQFVWREVQVFSGFLSRTMSFSMTITEETLYIACDDGDCEVSYRLLS